MPGFAQVACVWVLCGISWAVDPPAGKPGSSSLMQRKTTTSKTSDQQTLENSLNLLGGRDLTHIHLDSLIPESERDRHAGLVALAEKLESDPSSAASLKETIEPVLATLVQEMQTSHGIAHNEIDGLQAAFTACDTDKTTAEGNAAVPDGSQHSTCRQNEGVAKRNYDDCHSLQTTLKTLKDDKCATWATAQQRVASKDALPDVLPGEKLLDYVKRLLEWVETEISTGDTAKTGCEDATKTYDDQVVECEGQDGNGALKKTWLDAQQQCNTKQSTFETASCAYTQAMESACAVHGTCFSNAKTLWDTETAAIKADAESRAASFEMVERIRCFLEAFSKAGDHNEVDQAEVDKCKDATHDLTQFDLPIPATPAEPEECPELPKPCSQVWTSQVYSNASDAPLATCTPCADATASNTQAGARQCGTIGDNTGKTVEIRGDAISVDSSDCSMVFDNGASCTGYIVVENPGVDHTSSDFTIEGVVLIDPKGGYDVFMDTSQYRFGLQGSLLYSGKFMSSINVVRDLHPTLHQWIHVAMRYDRAAAKVQICLNGTCSESTDVRNDSPHLGAGLLIGGSDRGDDAAFHTGTGTEKSHCFTGKMRYLRQWSAKLSDEEIAQLATTGSITGSHPVQIEVTAFAV